MICLAFFFLLRPGEYTATTSESTPFRLGDVGLSSGGTYVNVFTAPDEDLDAADFVTLTFTTQKNGVRGEVIGLGPSGNANLCPVRSMVRRIKHLRSSGARPETPLSFYFADGKWSPVSPRDITSILKTALIALGVHNHGFDPNKVSCRSLRAAGAMALFCAKVDPETVRLLGRWNSDAMLRYLHLQAEPIMRNFSNIMLQGGQYDLLPNAQGVPQHPD